MLRVPGARQEEVKVAGSSVFGVYPKIDLEKTYNMFESDGWMVSFAGWRKVLELFPEGEGRGMFVSSRGNFMIVVVNNTVFRINPGLGKVQVGTLNTSSGQVFIDENLSSQICIVDGVNAYIYYYQNPPNLTVQTAGALGTGDLIPNHVTYHNTFFLFGNANRNSNGALWYAFEANPGDNTLIQAVSPNLTFETKPDYPIGVKVIPNQSANVLVMGRIHCEIHQQVGGLQNYQRNNSVSVDSGVASMDTVASDENVIMWVGLNQKNAPVIQRFEGQSAQRVSTDGIDNLLENIKRPERSTATFYRQEGHLFYIVTFYDPKDNVSLMYDLSNNKFYHLSDYKLNYFPARKIVYFDGSYYFVSLNNGAMYELNSNFYTQDENLWDIGGNTWNCGDPFPDDCINYDMQRLRITNTVRAPRSTRFIAEQFTMWIEQGTQEIADIDDCQIIMVSEDGIPIISEDGIQIVPENDRVEGCEPRPYQPAIDCSISIDGNISWSSSVRRYMNVTGKRRNILMWNQLGACNEITMKLRIWSKFRVCMTDGVLDLRM